MLSSAKPIHADNAGDAVLEVKFISMLPRFIVWPEGAFDSKAAPIRVGILGEDPFGGRLSKVLANASAHGRRYEVKSIASVEDASGLHILILTETRRSSLRKLARRLKGESVFTIARSFPFAEDGGILGMKIYRGKVAFEVNNRTARKSHLKISSKLLRLASNVY
jgi:hypothetical protein